MSQVFVIILMPIFQLREILLLHKVLLFLFVLPLALDVKKNTLTAATQVVFRNCAPFKDCRTDINDTFVDQANFINITMPMYNLIEYSDNYSDTSGSLWNFKIDETDNNADMIIMLLHLNIKQVLQVIQKTMEQKME